MDRGARLYAVVSSLVAHICDGFLYELLEDDRVCLRAQELEDAIMDEYEWLSHLPDEVWACFAELVADIPRAELRSQAMLSGSIVQAYIKQKAFRVVKSRPWSLALGDIAADLSALALRGDVVDSTSTKIRDLVRSGYPLHRVISAVELLREATWTSTSVEQGRGSAAALHRAHREYGANTLCMRSMLHMLRSLVAGPEDERGRHATRLAHKEDALTWKRPDMISARHVFLRDLIHKLKSESASGALAKADQRLAFHKHAFLFAALSPEMKQSYHVQAAL